MQELCQKYRADCVAMTVSHEKILEFWRHPRYAPLVTVEGCGYTVRLWPKHNLSDAIVHEMFNKYRCTFGDENCSPSRQWRWEDGWNG